MTLGGGYTHVSYTSTGAADQHDSFSGWNVGAAATWQQFGAGVVYSTDNGSLSHDGQNRTWVAGLDWTSGPFKLGASYLNNHEDLGDTTSTSGISNGTLNTTRWAPALSTPTAPA